MLAAPTCDPAPGRPLPLVLGALRVAPPIVLAPMSGITTLPMRTLTEEAGCALTITEFLAAPALTARRPKELHKLRASRGGQPFGVQIFGRDPGELACGAELAVEAGAALVDINMGCPTRKVTNGLAGAALMREPEIARALVRAVVGAVAGRAQVTVKIRAGWDDEHRNAAEFARAMVEAGAQAVTVHGRTRQQGFRGKADLEIIARVKQAVPVPVIGNGDVVDLESLERMFRETGCDGVMVGRAALGNPWLFSRFAAWWRGQPAPEPPGPAEKIAMYWRHLNLYFEIAPAERAVLEMRKFAGWYLRGFDGAASLRQRINTLTDVDSIRFLLDEACPPRRPAAAEPARAG